LEYLFGREVFERILHELALDVVETKPIAHEETLSSSLYTQTISRIGIWATRKLSQFDDRKSPHIVNIG
jgi:hypothetical protein